jgi:ATP-grasp domain, R2K clade family 3
MPTKLRLIRWILHGVKRMNQLQTQMPIRPTNRIPMRLIYPANALRPKLAEEIYADEFAAAQAAQIPISIFNFEDFQGGTFRPRPAIQSGETVLYRGWMLTPTDYTRLFDAVVAASGTPVTDVAAYTLCHHLPRWYPLLTEFTAETITFLETDDMAAALVAEGWSGCFLKDYVKSLSTDGGSVVGDLSTIPAVIIKMLKYRGQIEGGLCARRLEDYDPSSERRYFVWQGQAHSDTGEVPYVVAEAARRVSSPFFSVDVARRSDGALRIIELGDGQVSDRKHWDCHNFIRVLSCGI